MTRDNETLTLDGSDTPGPLAAVLRVLNSPATPRELKLTGGSCTVGAGREVDIIVEDQTVSRAHVEFTLVREGVAVRDLGSRNGTFYLGQRIERATVGLGTQLRIGHCDIAIEPENLSASALPLDTTRYGELLGQSLAMRRIFGMLHRLEGTLVNVLIEGESGTGKDFAARAIHDHSAVNHGPFVSVNCGTLDRSLARSELFGHLRGAFTGALEARVGCFEAASGGTLFLDEIGELPLDVQPMLLRALESGVVTRIGETRERQVTVRLIAATNRDLAMDVKASRFREDLFYRLKVVCLRMPSLRERVEDIDLLVDHFARDLALPSLPEALRQDFRVRQWPGNVREIRNALRAYAAVGAMDATKPSTDGLESMLRGSVDVQRPYAEQKDRLLESFLKAYLEVLLEHTQGNQSEAARVSGLERSYLNKVVRRLGRKSDDR